MLAGSERPTPRTRHRIAKAAAIAAALEIGRRIAGSTWSLAEPVRDPERLAARLMARYAHEVQERLGVVCLDARHRILCEREVFVGTLDSALVSTRDVLRLALENHAASVIVFHNHPSGDPTLSAEDSAFTRKLVEAGKPSGSTLSTT